MHSFLRKNQTFFNASFFKVLVIDIDCSVRKESLFESSWKSKLWKRKLVVFFTQLKPKIKNAQGLSFEWKQNFLKRDENATTWKRRSVLAKRSGSTLSVQENTQKTGSSSLGHLSLAWLDVCSTISGTPRKTNSTETVSVNFKLRALKEKCVGWNRCSLERKCGPIVSV